MKVENDFLACTLYVIQYFAVFYKWDFNRIHAQESCRSVTRFPVQSTPAGDDAGHKNRSHVVHLSRQFIAAIYCESGIGHDACKQHDAGTKATYVNKSVR
jgi:hypothetical protein